MTSDTSSGATTLDPWTQTIHFGGVFSNGTYTLSDMGDLFKSAHMDLPVANKAILFKKDPDRLNWPVPYTKNSLKLYDFVKDGSYLVSEPVRGNLLDLVLFLKRSLDEDYDKPDEDKERGTEKLRDHLYQVFSQLSIGVSQLRRYRLDTDTLSFKNVFYRYTKERKLYIMIACHLYPDGDGTGETLTGLRKIIFNICNYLEGKLLRDLPYCHHFRTQIQPTGMLNVDAFDVVKMHPFFWTLMAKVELVCLFVKDI